MAGAARRSVGDRARWRGMRGETWAGELSTEAAEEREPRGEGPPPLPKSEVLDWEEA